MNIHLVRNSVNATFSKSQKSHYARTWWICFSLKREKPLMPHILLDIFGKVMTIKTFDPNGYYSFCSLQLAQIIAEVAISRDFFRENSFKRFLSKDFFQEISFVRFFCEIPFEKFLSKDSFWEISFKRFLSWDSFWYIFFERLLSRDLFWEILFCEIPFERFLLQNFFREISFKRFLLRYFLWEIFQEIHKNKKAILQE